MTTYLPTIKQLQYLVALHEHGHFGRAAEASFVSQSTLSAGIRELELLAAGVRDLPVLQGWRYEIFGRDALELVEGKLAFAVENGRLKMTHIDDVAGEDAPVASADAGE